MFISRINRETPKPGKKSRIPGKKDNSNSESEDFVLEIDVVQISSNEEADKRPPQKKKKRAPANNGELGDPSETSSLDITA